MSKHIKTQTHPSTVSSLLTTPSLLHLIALVVFLLFQNALFFQPITAVTVALYLASWIVFGLVSLTKPKSLPISLVAVSVTFVSLFNVMRTGAVTNQIISVATLLFVGVVSAYTLSGARMWMNSLFEFALSPFLLFGSYLRAGLATYIHGHLPFRSHLSFLKKFTVFENVRTLVGGLLIGIPVVLILLSMFASADAVFAHFLKQFENIFHLPHMGQRFWWTVGTLLVALPVFALEHRALASSPQTILKKWPRTNEMSIVMGLVAATVGLFLVIQFPYIFVHLEKETSLSAFDVATYSEYVRKGFEELLKVAVVLFGLLWLGLTAWRNREPTDKKYLLMAQFVVLAEFAIFLLSLFRRVWLYQAFHGWTLAKIYGVWLLVGLTGFIVTLAARHFWKARWVRVEIIWMLAWFLVGSWFNAEHFIIQSKHLPTVNERVDYIYLARMSPDGYEGWVQSYGWAKGVLDSQLQKTPALYAESDRREIAYAARIVAELTRSYDHLVQKHASDEEFVQHYQTIFAQVEPSLLQQQAELKNLAVILEQRLAPLAAMEDESTNRLREQLRNVRMKQNDVDTEMKNIAELKQKLSERPLDREKIARFEVRAYTQYRFDENWVRSMCRDVLDAQLCRDPQTSFYSGYAVQYGETKIWNRDRFMFKLLNENASEQMALKRMRTEIPHGELMRLQATFFDLKRRIMDQPANEQTYDQDVSFDSPLMW